MRSSFALRAARQALIPLYDSINSIDENIEGFFWGQTDYHFEFS